MARHSRADAAHDLVRDRAQPLRPFVGRDLLGPLPPDKRRIAQKLPRYTAPAKRHLHRDSSPVMAVDELGLLASVPTTNSLLRPLLHRLFRNARSSIQMTMAYFAPDDELCAELCQAARRGVRVQMMLPGKSGLDVCKALRTGRAGQPAPAIIMITARVDEIDRLLGLELVRTTTYANHSARARWWPA